MQAEPAARGLRARQGAAVSPGVEALLYGLGAVSVVGNLVLGRYVLKLRGKAVSDGKDLRR
jgi:hypothetical protein